MIKWFEKWMRFAIAVIVTASSFFLFGFIYDYHIPKVKQWLLSEFENQSKLHTPLRVWPKDVQLRFIPLGVEFLNVKALPKGNLKTELAAFEVEKVGASISWVGLFRGQLRIGELWLENSELVYFAKEKPKSTNETKAAKPAKKSITEKKVQRIIKSIPIDEVRLKDINLSVKHTSSNFAGKIVNLNLSIAKESDRDLRVNFSSPSVKFKKLNETNNFEFSINTDFSATTEALTLSALQIKNQQNYIIANGDLSYNLSQLDLLKASFSTRTFLNLKQTTSNIEKYLKFKYDLPSTTGTLKSDLNISYTKSQVPSLSFDLGTKDVFIDGFELGNILATNIQYKEKILDIPKLNLQSSAGQFVIKEAKIDFNKPEIPIQSNINIKKMEVEDLLNSIKIKNVPINIETLGSLLCIGQIKKFELKCKGDLDIPLLQVWTDKKRDSEIVSFKNGKIKGQTTVNTKSVLFNTQLKINEAFGKTSGSVNYKKGFNIKYDGNIPSFEETFTNLSNLDIKGALKVKGRTYGDSNYGRIDMAVVAKEAYLEDFGLGSPRFNLKYKNGKLLFKNLKTNKNASRFEGDVNLDLKKSLINLKINSPFLDVADIKLLLENKLNLPFDFFGTGSANINLSGPLEINKLNFKLKSSFYRGLLSGESFDQFDLNLTGDRGHIKTDNVRVKKSTSTVQLRGTLDPKGNVEAIILGNKLRLEQSEGLGRLGLNIGGQLDFTSKVAGDLKSPNIDTFARLTKTIIGEKNEADSNLHLKVSKEKISGETKFFGGQVNSKFDIPFKNNASMSLYAKINQWDFSNLITLVSVESGKQGYSSSLSADIDLKSKRGWLSQANGSVDVTHFFIQRGDLKLESNSLMSINAKAGSFTSKNIKLTGPSSFINVDMKNSRVKDLDLSINGKFNMSLLSIFTPFLDDLRGTLSTSLNFKGALDNIDILGSTYIQDGFARLKGLNHAFERVTGDILFSQKSLLLNTLKAEFGGGVLTADGSVNFRDLNNIPVSIKGQLQNTNLNIPEGFSTKGNANMYIKGNNLPYTLGGTYTISSGNINYNLTPKIGTKNKIKPSDFLPKFLSKDVLDPIHLDFNILLDRPIPVAMSGPLFEANLSIDGSLNIKKSPSNPLFNGTIRSVPGGTVIFKSNTFEVNTAIFEYKNQSPTNPNLFATAQTRITSSTGTTDSDDSSEDNTETEDYEITMDIQGTGKKPLITLSSQPQLSESDIISLLALGVTSANLATQDDASRTQVIEAGSQLLFKQSGIGQAIKKTTGVEVGIALSDEAGSSQTISLKKQFTPKFGMSLSTTTGTASSNDLKAEYKFNNKWSVIGQIKNQDQNESSTTSSTEESNADQIGIDFEYKVNFK